MKRLNVARVVAAVAVVAVGAPAMAITPSAFTTANPNGGQPVGWTFAGNKFVGTNLGDGTGRMFQTDLTGGNIQPFGGTVNLLNGHGQEHYVAASLGLGGFPVGDIYVASDNNVQHITNAGVADPGLFINGSLGPINGLVRGIMFDNVGTFGNQMIITTDTGFVYTVNSTGIPTQIASLGEDTEGLDIAPLNSTWGTFNGWLFVASEGSGSIRAIKPSAFTVVNMATIGTAEQLTFVPMVLGANPLEGLYSARYPTDVAYTGASQFLGMEGNIIVTSEIGQQIWAIDPVNGTTQIGSYGPFQPEDGVFVTTEMLANLGVPEPTTVAVLALGLAGLWARRRAQ